MILFFFTFYFILLNIIILIRRERFACVHVSVFEGAGGRPSLCVSDFIFLHFLLYFTEHNNTDKKRKVCMCACELFEGAGGRPCLCVSDFIFLHFLLY